MCALIDTISEKLIILSLLNVHFLMSISFYVEGRYKLATYNLQSLEEESHTGSTMLQMSEGEWGYFSCLNEIQVC